MDPRRFLHHKGKIAARNKPGGYKVHFVIREPRCYNGKSGTKLFNLESLLQRQFVKAGGPDTLLINLGYNEFSIE